MFLLDTCICIDFLRGRKGLFYQKMREGKPEDFRLPAITAAELWYGAEHSSNPARETKVVEEFIAAFEAAPFDGTCAREYGRIRQFLGAKGELIGDRDMMIAATALACGGTLVTDNIREFSRIPNLSVESWSEIALP